MIGIIAILATIVLIAINPARQFKQARDTQRTSNVNAILNAIGQYTADNKGVLPAGIPVSPAAAENISDTGADLCDLLVPTYMPALTSDPGLTTGAMADGQISKTECGGSYDTGYKVIQGTAADGSRITVSAVGEITLSISVTR